MASHVQLLNQLFDVDSVSRPRLVAALEGSQPGLMTRVDNGQVAWTRKSMQADVLQRLTDVTAISLADVWHRAGQPVAPANRRVTFRPVVEFLDATGIVFEITVCVHVALQIELGQPWHLGLSLTLAPDGALGSIEQDFFETARDAVALDTIVGPTPAAASALSS